MLYSLALPDQISRPENGKRISIIRDIQVETTIIYDINTVEWEP